jgi:excisionase family DNA binding protein
MTTNNLNERLLRFLQATPEQLALVDRILAGKLEPVPAAPIGPLLVGMGAGAKLLGVSRATLWRMIRAGRLEKVEVLPGSFRVRRADLEAIAECRLTNGGSVPDGHHAAHGAPR